MADLTTPAQTTTDNDNADEIGLVPKHEVETHAEAGQVGEGAAVGADGAKKEPEEALETHEVVEINKFTERKEWIEEKTKLLESMPPIDVFAAVDAFLSLSEEIPPDLPTRPQLDHWLEEHDKIEKETEIFDAGDMSKLKKLTKAATQKNLSPEDTDLIELTLTTLLALDKLLHLLRDRSDTLDLLGLRLTWEEHRISAWRERRSIINDLQEFLTTRARWSLDTYELPLPSTPSPSPALRFSSPSPSASPRPSSSGAKRRDSAASLASISSDTSSSITGPSAAFSRSTRYKLAELLSHDAALYSSRLTALNHGKVTTAGKILDKFIDVSRKPVPDQILDEQDRLEDKAIKEIETVGKFALAVVMQWKRADEHYNDTMKDQAAAQALITEINNAKLQHPTPRHDAAFMSRAQALTKRLAVKSDPSLPRSSFPRPIHPLFPDQSAANGTIVKTLSTELSQAVKLARQAEASSLEYHAALEAVKRAEFLKGQIQSIDQQLNKLASKLIHGMHDERGHGDASPPDLNKETCLDPTRHATFLALLPSVVQELDQTDRAAQRALFDGRTGFIRLKELPGIDEKLKDDMVTAMKELEARRDAVTAAREDVLARAQRLKEARRLWGVSNDIMDSVEHARKQVLEGMESQRWKVAEGRHDNAPMTPDPDSPELNSTPLPVTVAPHELPQKFDVLRRRLSTDVEGPLARLASSLEKPLSQHLQTSSEGLVKHIDHVRGMVRVWDGIAKQAEAMTVVQREARELEEKIDTLQTNIDDARQRLLHDAQAQDETTARESDLNFQATALRESVRKFTDSLATCVPLVSRTNDSRALHLRSNSFSSLPSPTDYRLNRLKEPPAMTLPFDLSALDNGVRAEANTLALGLAGGMQSVAKKLDYLRLSQLAKLTDVAVDGLAQVLGNSEQALSDLGSSYESTSKVEPSGIDTTFSEKLAAMIEQVDQFKQDHNVRVARSTSPVQQALQTLQAAPGAHDSPVHGTIVLPRSKAVEDILHRADFISESTVQLRGRIVESQRKEENRLSIEKERLEAERAKQEEARLQAEEKARLEKERLEAEERARLEQQRLDAQEKARVELASRREGERAANKPKTPDEDVFGRRLAPSQSSTFPLSPQLADLRGRIMSIRTRLRSLNLSGLVRLPASHDGRATAALPSSREASDTRTTFSALEADAATLPVVVTEDASVDSELQSLRSELDTARPMVQRLIQLGQFGDQVTACDHALSDLLEHSDTYPAAPPARHLASPHISDSRLPCEEQLANRLVFTKDAMGEMSQSAATVSDDSRVAAEQIRLQQTWSELADMCTDRINGTRSRPASSVSSTGRSSGAASASSAQRKPKPSLNGNGSRPKPRERASRRAASGAHDPISRPPSHMSNRSVSGPSGFSSLYNTTFASRQRTTSLASIQSAIMTPFKRPMSPTIRPRTASKRPGSPAFSETSTHSVASTPSRSSWSRAPRQSFGTVPRNFQTHDTPKRKAYVANPKSKLDIAVGNVVNNFRLPVTIQAAGDGWKDQSGKYWIGEAEPKLCFCRILRSQTVMVRVGGGWCELSKFLRDHFMDLLAELPPSPPRKEERWINAATVREAMESPTSVPVVRVLATPEPKGPGLLPSLHLSTPNGTSPQSLKTASSPGDGSPSLTPFQFMRRADAGPRPVTPSPAKSTRSKPVTPSVGTTPSRTNIWRP